MKKIYVFLKLFFQINFLYFVEELKRKYSKILQYKIKEQPKNILNPNPLNKYFYNSKTSEKILITSFLNIPEYLQYEYITALYLSNLLNLDIEILIEKNDKKSKNFFLNLGYKKFIYYDEGNLLKRYKNIICSFIKIFKIGEIENFIDLKIKNIPIGKSVYSHYSRFTGSPTINKIDAKLIVPHFLKTN